MNGLMVHAGGQLMTREQLKEIPPPPSMGRMHRPVPHAEFVNALMDQLPRFGLNVVEEQFATNKGHAQFFGVLRFDRETGIKVKTKTCSVMGIRSSTDESFAMSGVAGAHVFVCDNLCYHGDEFVFSRKHTLHVQIELVIEKGITRYLGAAEAMEFEFSRLATIDVTPVEASDVFTGLIKDEVVPDRYVGKAVREYFNPSGEDTEPRSLWGIHNAVTRQVKTCSVGTKMQHTQALSRFMSKLAK